MLQKFFMDKYMLNCVSPIINRGSWIITLKEKDYYSIVLVFLPCVIVLTMLFISAYIHNTYLHAPCMQCNTRHDGRSNALFLKMPLRKSWKGGGRLTPVTFSRVSDSSPPPLPSFLGSKLYINPLWLPPHPVAVLTPAAAATTSRIHERTISLRFLGIIFKSRVLETWGFRIQCLHYKPVSNHLCWREWGGRGGGFNLFVEVTANSKEKN